MRKQIIIAATFTACLALCAAVWPKTAAVEETSMPSETTIVSAPQPTLPEAENLETPMITEKEMVKTPEVEPTPEDAIEEPLAPFPEAEKQPESEQESTPSMKPEPKSVMVPLTQPELEPTPGPKPGASNNSSEDMVYVPGFGWIESQGPSQVEYAEDMYENGNKIGCMG